MNPVIRVYVIAYEARHEIEIGDVRVPVIDRPKHSDWDSLPPGGKTRELEVIVSPEDARALLAAAAEADLPPETQVRMENSVYLKWELPLDQLLLVRPFDPSQKPKTV